MSRAELDHAGIAPNPARDKLHVRLPREERDELNPPTAHHVEAVYRTVPAPHRLPLLWLDWSGARVGSVDNLRVSDYDETLRRVRLRASVSKSRRALWVDLPDEIADAINATLPPHKDRETRRAPVRRVRVERASHRDCEGMPRPRDPAVVAARPSPSAHIPAASARPLLGADRAVRRAAEPRRSPRTRTRMSCLTTANSTTGYCSPTADDVRNVRAVLLREALRAALGCPNMTGCSQL